MADLGHFVHNETNKHSRNYKTLIAALKRLEKKRLASNAWNAFVTRNAFKKTR